MLARIVLTLILFAWNLNNAQAQSFWSSPSPKKAEVKTPEPSPVEVEVKTSTVTEEEILPVVELPPTSPTPEQMFALKKPLLDNIDYTAQNYRPEEAKELVRVLNNMEKREKRRLQRIEPEKAATAPSGNNTIDATSVDEIKALLDSKFAPPSPQYTVEKEIPNEQ